MGREIRRVPPDWEHPKNAGRGRGGKWEPVFDEVYDDVAKQWIVDCVAWDNGTHPDRAEYPQYRYFWEYADDPPDPLTYRHRAWTTEEATAYQVYECTTEGTPLSPVLPTREALIAWLTAPVPRGEDDYGVCGLTPEQAERFAGRGSAFTFVDLGNGLVPGAKAGA